MRPWPFARLKMIAALYLRCVGASTPAEARRHYDTMVQRMGPGVWPRSIKAIGELCGWPVPDGAKNAKQIG